MDIATIKNELKQKQFQPFYIFTGSEWYAQNIYVNQIAKTKGCEVKRIDSIVNLVSNLRNKSSIVNKNYVYVARDDKEFLSKEELQQNISHILRDNIFILLLTTVDKRTKFYKQYKDKIVEFDPFDAKILKKYIQKEIDLSDRNCEKLMDICESDYGRCLLEIDKIKQYAKGFVGDYGYDNFFKMLLYDGTINTPPKDAIFDFVEAVMQRSNKCWQLLEQCYAVGEATMVLLSVLYTNMKQTLQLQSCESKDISKSTGLTGWQIQCAKKHVSVYSNSELVNGMRLVQEIESGIKTGKIEEELSVPYLLVSIL